MMFKEEYKAINNSIPVNQDLLLQLLATEKRTEHKRKNSKISIYFKFATPVAAAIILLITIPNLGLFMNNETPVQPEENLKTTEIKTEIAAEDTADEKNSLKDLKENITSSSFDIAAKVEATTEDSMLDTEESSEAGAGTHSFRANKAFEKAMGNSLMNVDEYLMLSGIDLSEIVLPAEVVKETTLISPLYDEDGNLILAECSINFSGENKNMTLTISKTTDFLADIGKENMISEDSAIFYNGELAIGYIKCGDTFYKAECIGFSEAEISDLLNSLK